ncbi:bifunctional N-acetylglucosamine-1-phosphate uridyltransferase/glucosamine-1-phosphate acetyltransferase [Planctomycetota bacterium]
MKTFNSIILAAGKGVRMQSEVPKVLHNLCGQPVLDYILKTVRQCRAKAIYVVAGTHGDGINKRFIDKDIKWVYQGKPRGTGHAVLAVKKALAGSQLPLLVLYGDVPLITSEILNNLLATHARNKEVACTVLTCLLEDPSGYGRVIKDQLGRIKGIIEDNACDETQKNIKEINSGIYVFNPKSLFSLLKEVKPNPKSKEYYLTDVIALLAQRGYNIQAFKAPDAQSCLGINSREDLVLAEEIMQKRIKTRLLQSGVTIIDPANTYIEADVKVGKDTVIQPFTMIRSGVTIGQSCEVGPFTQLRVGTELANHAEVGNFTEVKKSRLGSYSKAKHLSYLGDTYIGAGVNIGAGTITANYDGKDKHKTVIADGASTGSGTVLVAPVKLGKRAVTGAGAVIMRGKNVPAGVTVIGIPAQPLTKRNTIRLTRRSKRKIKKRGN